MLPSFPIAVAGDGLWSVLVARAHEDSFRLVATAIFALAIIHTFLAPAVMRRAHHARGRKAKVLHLLGEIELVFALWAIVLFFAMLLVSGWAYTAGYVLSRRMTEPFFVTVVMVIAGSSPILALAERVLGFGASLGRSSVAAWWFAILSLGPLLGSLITEPAAMTICALLLSDRLYRLKPSARLAYGTLGLLFVDVSIGGALTSFAAPPIVMVARRWDWTAAHVFMTFGWRSVVAIVVSNLTGLVVFRRELAHLDVLRGGKPVSDRRFGRYGILDVLFLIFAVWTGHSLPLLVLTLGLYLTFDYVVRNARNLARLRQPLLIGLFLAGLVIHGGLQDWWIGPVLTGRGRLQLFFGAGALTSFNDNAAITYLATLVPNLTARLQDAVVAGAIVGGGLTVIANAPNPAGQGILSAHFPQGVSPVRLFLGAMIPTAIAAGCFLCL